MTSIIEASYGEVYVDDMALSQHRDAIKKKIAYVPDSPDLFLNLTANDYWYFLTRIYDLEASQVEERLTNLMAKNNVKRRLLVLQHGKTVNSHLLTYGNRLFQKL